MVKEKMVEIEDMQREFNIHIIEVFEEGKHTITDT